MAGVVTHRINLKSLLDKKDIAELIEGSVTQMRNRDNAQNPNAIIVELCDVVNSKLNVNLAVLEITLYAACVVSTLDGNYSLPKSWTHSEHGASKDTIAHRSSSAAMAYEDQKETILNPDSFFHNDRPSHPMDVFLLPREVIESNYR